MSVLSLSYWESDVYWRKNNKHFAELAQQNGEKQLIWRNYAIVTLCIRRLHDAGGCQTGCRTGLTTVLNEQPLFVQPVVKPDWQPVWQQVVSCKRGFTAPTSLNGGQPNFARCLAVSWAGALYIIDVTYSRLDVSLRTALLGGDGPTVIRHYRG